MKYHAMLYVLATVMMASQSARAASDAQTCEAKKYKIVGNYYFCNAKAEAKAILTGGVAEHDKCTLKFEEKWEQADSAAGGACPDDTTVEGMQAYVLAQATEMAAIVAGADLPSCGDGVINIPGEQCDASDLGGETCATLGFHAGTLRCDASCGFDTDGCVTPVQLLETRQTDCDQGNGVRGPCPGTPDGQDGAVRAGISQSYTDNGDGTVTDNATGLTWEKLSNDGTVHDADNTYTWYTAFSAKIDALNAGGGFAGYTDWRLPNVRELETLVDSGYYYPVIADPFYASCSEGCTVLTCSCTRPATHWTSTSYANPEYMTYGWGVSFWEGASGLELKDNQRHVRAVRGGL